MNITKYTELAKECLKSYDIDFADLNISEDNIANLISIGVIDILNKIEITNEVDRESILISIITTLIVESFVLNTRILKGK